MKLGEALARRSELQIRHGQVRERLRANAMVQEGSKPSEDPAKLVKELDAIAAELERLIAQINHTNDSSAVKSGMSLTAALAKRDVLGLQQTAFRAVVDATTQQQPRYSRSEIRIILTVDIAQLRQRADDLARQRRELDVEIQEANWTVDLIERQ